MFHGLISNEQLKTQKKGYREGGKHFEKDKIFLSCVIKIACVI